MVTGSALSAMYVFFHRSYLRYVLHNACHIAFVTSVTVDNVFLVYFVLFLFVRSLTSCFFLIGALLD